MKPIQRLVAVASIPTLLIACASNRTATRETASVASYSQPSVELGEVWGDAQVAQANEVLDDNEKMLIARTKEGEVVHRDAHPKTHGCAKAFIDVDPSGLPEELRVGIFSKKTSRPLPAWVRYSNGNPDGATAPDLKKDVRGMAIKIMNVQGTPAGSQDFVMLTSKEFFSVNAADYVALHRALAGGQLKTLAYLAAHPKNAKNLLGAQIKTGNSLAVNYFSSVPYKLGPKAMKFKATPCEGQAPDDPIPSKKTATHDYLRERLAKTLSEKPGCYDLWVQPNNELDKQPVEDPTKAWNEKASPYIRVATVNMPRQSGIDSPEQEAFCENLSFNPWNSLPQTRPVGQINRMRLQIYRAISKFRHEKNGIPEAEPRSHEPCSQPETAPLCKARGHH